MEIKEQIIALVESASYPLLQIILAFVSGIVG